MEISFFSKSWIEIQVSWKSETVCVTVVGMGFKIRIHAFVGD
jgi:hypothetical protein